MALPWVRIDTNIATHDKILALLDDPSPKRWQAVANYLFAIGWSGGQGTDGHVPASALGAVHATATTARLLVKYGLWEENGRGWRIRNFEERQELATITEHKRARQRLAARKTNCQRYHGPACGCWKKGESA